MLTIHQKIESIQKLVKKHEISAYEFGKNADISEMSAYNIISGANKNPRNKTLNIMLEYIKGKIVGSAIPGHKNYNPLKIEHLTSDPENESLEERISNLVVKKLEPYLKMISAIEKDTSKLKRDVFKLNSITQQEGLKEKKKSSSQKTQY